MRAFNKPTLGAVFAIFMFGGFAGYGISEALKQPPSIMPSASWYEHNTMLVMDGNDVCYKRGKIWMPRKEENSYACYASDEPGLN